MKKLLVIICLSLTLAGCGNATVQEQPALEITEPTDNMVEFHETEEQEEIKGVIPYKDDESDIIYDTELLQSEYSVIPESFVEAGIEPTQIDDGVLVSLPTTFDELLKSEEWDKDSLSGEFKKLGNGTYSYTLRKSTKKDTLTCEVITWDDIFEIENPTITQASYSFSSVDENTYFKFMGVTSRSTYDEVIEILGKPFMDMTHDDCKEILYAYDSEDSVCVVIMQFGSTNDVMKKFSISVTDLDMFRTE